MMRPAIALFVAAVACGPERISGDGEDQGATDSASASSGRDTIESEPSTAGAGTTSDGADELPPPDVPGFGCSLPAAANAEIAGHASDGGELDQPVAVRFAWYGNTGGGRCAPGHRVVITSVAEEFENSFYVGWQYKALTIDLVIGESTAEVGYEDWLYAHAIARVAGVGTVAVRGGVDDDEPLVGSVSVDVEGLQAEGDFAAIRCPLLDAPPCP